MVFFRFSPFEPKYAQVKLDFFPQMSCVYFGGVGCIHWQNTPTPCLRGRCLLRFWPTRCVGFVRRLRGGYAVLFGADLFSPTANSFGVFSHIVKVSGQNCFRTLYGSLGQVRLGQPKGSAEGSTKVPPRFCKFGGVSASLGQIRLGLQKVPPRWCLCSGADPSWAGS